MSSTVANLALYMDQLHLDSWLVPVIVTAEKGLDKANQGKAESGFWAFERSRNSQFLYVPRHLSLA